MYPFSTSFWNEVKSVLPSLQREQEWARLSTQAISQSEHFTLYY